MAGCDRWDARLDSVAVLINAFWPVLPGGWLGAVGFGLTVGLAGVLGDLAESLLKRDLQTKDASQAVPGFGGVLDVIDSLLFAAPVAYLWFGSPFSDVTVGHIAKRLNRCD